jgi:hypothetical protein
MLTLQQREDLRVVVLGYLAARHPLAFTAAGIRFFLLRREVLDFEFSVEEVLATLTFLKDPNFVTVVHCDVGTSQHWSATATGVLEAERKDWLLP